MYQHSNRKEKNVRFTEVKLVENLWKFIQIYTETSASNLRKIAMFSFVLILNLGNYCNNHETENPDLLKTSSFNLRNLSRSSPVRIFYKAVANHSLITFKQKMNFPDCLQNLLKSNQSSFFTVMETKTSDIKLYVKPTF